jgi:hypothetical protein
VAAHLELRSESCAGSQARCRNRAPRGLVPQGVDASGERLFNWRGASRSDHAILRGLADSPAKRVAELTPQTALVQTRGKPLLSLGEALNPVADLDKNDAASIARELPPLGLTRRGCSPSCVCSLRYAVHNLAVPGQLEF